MYLLTANSVTSNTRVKLQTSFVIDGTTIKIMLERLTGKSLVCRNSWHKSVVNEASVTFIDKTDGRKRYCMQTLKTMEPYGFNIADSK